MHRVNYSEKSTSRKVAFCVKDALCPGNNDPLWLPLLGFARAKRIGVICKRLLSRGQCALPLILTLWAPLMVAAESQRTLALPPATVPEGLGVNIHFTDPVPGELAMIAGGGFRWVRMDFTWAATERTRGLYDFTAYERLLTALAAYKLRAVFILNYSNELYEADRSVATETGRRAFARWAASAASHFKDRGILWEIWNEPNGGEFWKPRPDPVQYTALASLPPGPFAIPHPTSWSSVRRARRSICHSWKPASRRGCFNTGMPSRSIHTDSAIRKPRAQDYVELHRLIARYAPKGKAIPILSGEWGYSSAWQGYDAESQGKLLARQWLTNLANHIPLSIWYDWHDDGTDLRDPEHHFGTVGFEYHPGRVPVYDPKPAYLAAKTLTEVLGGFQFAKRIATGSRDDYVLLFRQGDAMKVAAWTTATERHEIRLPSGPCTFDIVDHVGRSAGSVDSVPARLPVTGGNFLTVPLAQSPRYLIARGANRELADAPAALPLEVSLLHGAGRLTVKVENLSEAAFRGKVRLADVEGLQPVTREQPLAFVQGEREKVVRFALASRNPGIFRVGLRVEDERGVTMLSLPAQLFAALPANIFEACVILPDGDPKVGSAHSLVPSPAPEPLPDPSLPVVKLTYRFGAGWKFLRLVPRPAGQFAGRPKGFGLWIYGDGRQASPRLRMIDTSGKTWQPAGGVDRLERLAVCAIRAESIDRPLGRTRRRSHSFSAHAGHFVTARQSVQEPDGGHDLPGGAGRDLLRKRYVGDAMSAVFACRCPCVSDERRGFQGDPAIKRL